MSIDEFRSIDLRPAFAHLRCGIPQPNRPEYTKYRVLLTTIDLRVPLMLDQRKQTSYGKPHAAKRCKTPEKPANFGGSRALLAPRNVRRRSKAPEFGRSSAL
jgi:hypothetical protein